MIINEDSYTIVANGGQFLLSVKHAFKKRYSENEGYMYQLINEYKILDYLHCNTGPAIIDTVNNTKQYFFNGKPVAEKDIEKMVHDGKFTDYMETLLISP